HLPDCRANWFPIAEPQPCRPFGGEASLPVSFCICCHGNSRITGQRVVSGECNRVKWGGQTIRVRPPVPPLQLLHPPLHLCRPCTCFYRCFSCCCQFPSRRRAIGVALRDLNGAT